MKKSTLMLAATMALAVSTASAQTVREYPPMRMPAEGAKVNVESPMKAPLNTEKALGTKIFGATAYDFDVARHYVTLYSSQPGILNKLNTILFPGTSDETVPTLHEITAGAWAGDGYYAYKAAYYTATGSTHLDCWVKVDPETGHQEILKDLVGNWYPKNWNMIRDLSYNYTNNKFYGLAYGDANDFGAMTTQLVEIDKNTGDLIRVAKKFDEFYFCMAFDYDGNLYAIRWTYNADSEITGSQLDVFDSDFDKVKSTPLYVDGQKLKIYFENGLEFDHTTGDLYWSSADLDQKGRLIRIDPSTAVTENLGTTGYNEMLKGLYIPFVTADSRTAPAKVNNLKFTIDANGNNNVTLTWTNPTTQWNRKALPAMTDVKIWRDNFEGAPVVTLDATGKVGAEMSWTDTEAAAGVHTYYVVPCCKADEKGVVDKIEAYVGRDKAGPVQNLVAVATPDGKGVTVSWTAPVTGDSNGWFDAASLSYSITRLPDNKKFDGSITETTFTDANIPEAQAYSYVITPITVDGEGTPFTSNQVIAGNSILPPFMIDFNNQTDAERFTVLDLNQDGTRFGWGANNNKVCKSMVIIQSNHENDDMLVTPPLALKAGKTYRVKYYMSFGAYGRYDRVINHKMRIMGGETPTIEGMKTLHQDFEFQTYGLYPEYVLDGYVESPVDGDYYVGLELMTSFEEDMWTYIEKFEITELSDKDMSVENVKTYLNLSNMEDNTFVVDVFNHGKEAANGYKVQMAYLNYLGEPQVFAEAEYVPELAPKTGASVFVKGKPDRVGEARLVAIVSYDGDSNADNDMSEPINVNIDEYYAFNYTVDSEDLVDDPNIPMTHYNNLSVTQTIYTPDITKLPKEGDAVIRRLAWEYEGKDAFDGTYFEVYLNNTTKNGFADGEGFVNIYDEPVYVGTFSTIKGVNYLIADLDEEFTYDLTKNLMVTVVKHEAEHNDWLLYFKSIYLPWSETANHSMRYGTNGDSTFDVSKASTLGSKAAKRDATLPVLHISADFKNGVHEVIGTFASAVVWDAASSTLRSAGEEFRNVAIYNLSGAMVSNMAVSGNVVKCNVAPGVYIVKALLADGTSANVKIFVK